MWTWWLIKMNILDLRNFSFSNFNQDYCYMYLKMHAAIILVFIYFEKEKFLWIISITVCIIVSIIPLSMNKNLRLLQHMFSIIGQWLHVNINIRLSECGSIAEITHVTCLWYQMIFIYNYIEKIFCFIFS